MSDVSLDADLERLREIPDPIADRRVEPVASGAAPTEPSQTRSERARLSGLAIAGAVMWAVGLVCFAGLRADLPTAHVVTPIAVLLVAAAIGGGIVLGRRDRGLPAGLRVVQHAVWAVPAVYVVVAAVIATPPADMPCTETHGACIALSSAIALGAMGAAVFALRRSFLSAAGWRGAAVGALAGLSGSIGIHAHCPAQHFDHLLVAHGAPILLFAIAGALLGRLGGRP